MVTWAYWGLLVASSLAPSKMSPERSRTLILLVPSSPKTNWTASMMLLFPLPLGPVITLKPESKLSFTVPLKDLKFRTTILLMCTNSGSSPSRHAAPPVIP